MNARLLAELEEYINKWSDANCEKGDWPNGYWYEEQTAEMAKAASLVFDASNSGQAFAKTQDA